MQPLHTLCRRIGNFVLLFGAMPDLHYINGPDTLPPPLTPQEEQQALCGLAAGEVAARDALITHNLRLVVYIAKKFESSTAGVEDMISIGTIGLIKAVNTFEPGKNIKLHLCGTFLHPNRAHLSESYQTCYLCQPLH